jgi:hypothetical protein
MYCDAIYYVRRLCFNKNHEFETYGNDLTVILGMNLFLQISALHLLLFIRGTESAKMTDKFHIFYVCPKSGSVRGSESVVGIPDRDPPTARTFCWPLPPPPTHPDPDLDKDMNPRESVRIQILLRRYRFQKTCRKLSCFSLKFMLFLHPNSSLKTLLQLSFFDTPFRITDWSRMVLKISLTSYGYVTTVCPPTEHEIV